MMTPVTTSIPNPTIDKLMRHWLLDIAVEFPRSLVLLFPFVEGEALNAKTIHGQQPESYAKGLINLFENGLIRFSSDVPGDEVQTSAGVERLLERFVRLSKDDSLLRREGQLLSTYQRRHIKELQVSFELTSEGGRVWESDAEPNWDRCFTQSTGDADCELVSSNLDRIMAVIGWFPEIVGGRVDVNSIRIQRLDDSPILYWKHLPSVFKANFAFDKTDPRWSSDGPAWPREPKWFHDWRVATASWYRKPWEMPAWPSE